MNSDMTITAHFEKNQGAPMWWLLVIAIIVAGAGIGGIGYYFKKKKS